MSEDVYKEAKVAEFKEKVLDLCRETVNIWIEEAQADVFYQEMLVSNDQFVDAVLALGKMDKAKQIEELERAVIEAANAWVDDREKIANKHAGVGWRNTDAELTEAVAALRATRAAS